MASNRKQPFGYRMEKGEIVPHEKEAEVVRWIYGAYLAGAAYSALVVFKSGTSLMTPESYGTRIWLPVFWRT